MVSHAEDLLPYAIGKYAEQVLPGYIQRPVAALYKVSEHEREQLVETVEIYIPTGSVKSTSERTFSHRNTVINRLKAFESCTGLSPLKCSELGRIQMALAALAFGASA